MTVAPEGRDQAEPRPDARGAAGVHPLRPVREHRARQQLARRRPRRAGAWRVPDHRVRLRIGYGHGEVLRHHLPDRRPAAERDRARRDRSRAQAPRREHRRRGGRDRGGAANLARHIGIVSHFGLQAVVGVNKFPTDTQGYLKLVKRLAVEHGAYAAEVNTAFEDGGRCCPPARRGGRRGRGRALGVSLRVRVGRTHRGEDPRDRDRRLRRRRSVPAQDGEGQGGRVRGVGARRPADLHGEDAPLALARRRRS